MKGPSPRILVLVLALLLTLAGAATAQEPRPPGPSVPSGCSPGAKYDPACDDNGDGVVDARDLRLVWFTVDGGAATLQGVSGYQLLATAGQPDAGTLAGGGYTLSGGFLVRAAPLAGFAVFLPIILRK